MMIGATWFVLMIVACALSPSFAAETDQSLVIIHRMPSPNGLNMGTQMSGPYFVSFASQEFFVPVLGLPLLILKASDHWFSSQEVFIL